MKKIVFLFLSFVVNICAAQQYKFLSTIAVKGNSFTTDNLGNWFVINNDQLIRYRSPEREPYIYSNKRLGNITSVDASNPLKIIVFYRDFSKIVFLDNTLSENGAAITLQDFDLDQTSVVCTSYDNGFWVFDQQNFLLIRFDKQLNETVRIKNLHLIVNRAVEPNFMIEYDNRLYMNDPQSGILIFDIFGTYYKTIPIKKLVRFQVIGKYISYLDEQGKFMWYDMTLIENMEVKLPRHISEIEPRIEKDRLFIFKGDSLMLYEIKQ